MFISDNKSNLDMIITKKPLSNERWNECPMNKSFICIPSVNSRKNKNKSIKTVLSRQEYHDTHFTDERIEAKRG